MVESSDPLEKEMANRFRILALRIPRRVEKAKIYDTGHLPQVSNMLWSNMSSMLLRKSGKKTLERMKRLDQSENHAHLRMHLVSKVKFNAVKDNTLHASN